MPPHLDLLRRVFFDSALPFKKTFLDVQSMFGSAWDLDFDAHLGRLFGTDEKAYRNAVHGYTRFSLDAMRLQRLFNARKRYEDVSYDEASKNVYMNDDYMLGVYLPGIFLSQFLWRHHYRQLLYYRTRFLPLLASIGDTRFYEVGTGTGFFTVQMFQHDARFRGYGIDISPHSRRFTLSQVNGWGCGDRFESVNADIFQQTFEPLPCIQTVEVLEHLPDPQLFLDRLRAMLAPGGLGFIAVAITAPQADHIYLYWEPGDVIQQLQKAGFTVQDYQEERAYEGEPGEIVPKVAAFIIS